MTKQQAKQQQHQFYSSTLIASIKDNQIFIPAFVTLIILVVTSLVFFFYKRSKAKANTILIIGPSGSGKSAIFGKLVNQNYPGAETLRKALFNKWFNEQINSVCCVIFVVDSATFSKKDVAEYLYDVLYETKSTKIPVLVVCNKQDLAHAKAGQLIEKLIEQEFGLINISREAALSLTEGSGDLSLAEQQKILTNNGQEFKWENLNDVKNKKERPLFVECSAIEQEKENNEFSLDPLRKWIGEKCCYF
uniref:Signal recognition particle receptor subunit beta n=2 Tax=Meloidogyne floridensis TaxID=298350 RepID=A0A915NGS5_9BILA